MIGSGAPRRAESVADDSRGILAPRLLDERTAFSRYAPEPPLAGLVDRFWAARWDLPDGVVHTQRVLQHPATNISVATPDARTGRREPEARLTGTVTALTDRALAGRGWVVALKTTVGGISAFVECPAARLVGQVVEVAAIARVAETDRTVRRLDQLAERAGVSPRALQRMFARHTGLSPTWVLRRYRLIDAAEAVRRGERVAWTQVADQLGYSDQAHLVRDFRATIGASPEAYARAQR